MKLLKGQKLRDDGKAKVPLVKDQMQDKGPSLLFNFRKIETVSEGYEQRNALSRSI